MKRLSLIFALAIMMLCISCSTNDVMYFDYKIPKDMLSDTTLEWLEWLIVYHMIFKLLSAIYLVIYDKLLKSYIDNFNKMG